ncbi:MAG: M48 family peptidase [Deltaproteobacteria bacterium HGW-Deltaproteobacteria-4]|nr:MAG: M48 family peptidase [Deltaproteobacteria bacterium HGW-Deltaproteobacteria-4]
MTTRTLTLSDGRSITYHIRRSQRAKHVGLRLSRQAGLQVTVPLGVTLARVDAVVLAKSVWIIKHLTSFAAMPPALPVPTAPAPLPLGIALPALGETWTVAYAQSGMSGVRAATLAPGELQLRGAVADEELCRRVLRLWLAQRAEMTLLPQLQELAIAAGFRYVRGQIRGQRTRWGSCSGRGTISLNWHLLFLAPEQVRYVLLHELCHTVELNHSPRFWRLLQQHQPDSEALRKIMRRAWHELPAWLHEAQQPRKVD